MEKDKRSDSCEEKGREKYWMRMGIDQVRVKQ